DVCSSDLSNVIVARDDQYIPGTYLEREKGQCRWQWFRYARCNNPKIWRGTRPVGLGIISVVFYSEKYQVFHFIFVCYPEIAFRDNIFFVYPVADMPKGCFFSDIGQPGLKFLLRVPVVQSRMQVYASRSR